LFFAAAFILVSFLAFSINAQAEEQSKDQKKPLQIAVIPFQALGSDSDHGGTVICPICGIASSSGRISKDGEKIVEEIFIKDLLALKDMELISPDKVESVYKRISVESLRESSLDVLKKAGHELKADYVAAGYVYRYAERVGYRFSTERPASVVFEIHLIDSGNGNVIWRGFFDKTQKSLMEDVFQISSFFKGGAKWLTARQLAEQGMSEVFKTFPDLQR